MISLLRRICCSVYSLNTPKKKNNNKCENEGEASCQVQSAARWGVDGLLLLLTACAPSSLIKLKVAAGVTALSSLQRRNRATPLAQHLQGCAAARYALPVGPDASAPPSAADVSVRPGGEDEGLLAPQRGAAAHVLQAKSPGKLADALLARPFNCSAAALHSCFQVTRVKIASSTEALNLAS